MAMVALQMIALKVALNGYSKSSTEETVEQKNFIKLLAPKSMFT